MTLDNTAIVDAAGLDRESGGLVLSIIDTWDWSDESAQSAAIQEKINNYFNFIESRQAMELYPSAAGKQIIIDIVECFELPAVAIELFKNANNIGAELGVVVRWRLYSAAT